MKSLCFLLLTSAALIGAETNGEVLFRDEFKGKLGEGWSWVREHPAAWRATERGLEVRIEPGNMWGPQNNARNVLVRIAPDTTQGEIEVGASIENKPTNQYEQVDLVWYYDDSNMVKLGEELVDGRLSIVMGREENDKTRTVAIIPLSSTAVRLRLYVKGGSDPRGVSACWRQGMADRRRMHPPCPAQGYCESEPPVLSGSRSG